MENFTKQQVIALMAEVFYRHSNPESTMNTPNAAFIYAQKMFDKYITKVIPDEPREIST